MPEEYKRKPNTNCLICKKEIYRRPSQIKGGRVFCSVKCAGIACRKEEPCPICGKMILGGLNKKTCSRACANKHREGIRYTMSRPHDKVKYQQGLKLRLIAERGTKCERCDYNKFEILQIHHTDRNRKNNDLKNLQLICPNCHFEEHLLKKSWLTKRLKNIQKRVY